MKRDDRRLPLTYLPALLIAIALLAAMIWRFWPASERVSGPELYREYFLPYPNVVAPIKSETPPKNRSLRERAYQAYESYDYGQADILLGKLPQSDTTQFYRAMIAMVKEQPEQARSLLTSVAGDSKSAFQPAAEWYQALLLLQQSDWTSSEARLERIAATPEHPYSDRARSLLANMQ